MAQKKAPKNTRQAVINLLRQFSENAMALAKIAEEQGDDVWRGNEVSISIAYDTAISLLASNEDFADYWKIFNRDKEA